MVYNGVEKYKINWLTCYKLRPFVADALGQLPHLRHGLPVHQAEHLVADASPCRRSARRPIPARPLLVRALKSIDDRFWGTVQQKRVRWLGYDSGIKPGEKACTVAGCTAAHEARPAAEGRWGTSATTRR